jgi:hypothetical protein
MCRLLVSTRTLGSPFSHNPRWPIQLQGQRRTNDRYGTQCHWSSVNSKPGKGAYLLNSPTQGSADNDLQDKAHLGTHEHTLLLATLPAAMGTPMMLYMAALIYELLRSINIPHKIEFDSSQYCSRQIHKSQNCHQT